MVSECSHEHELANDLCYPICQEGYEGVIDNCWSKCPTSAGFKSNGTFCQKPKGVGRGIGSQNRCNGCEKWGIRWFPQCPVDHHTESGLMCSPDCPQGMADLGQQCQKIAFSRADESQPMICPHGMEQEDYMCYEPCGENQTGSHNVCWGQCPKGTEQCGVLCLGHGE